MSNANQRDILVAIDTLVRHCEALDSSIAADEIIVWEITELRNIRAWVTTHWPLNDQQKGQLRIGTVAAKNLYDWLPPLANSLMQLDFVLKTDGEHLDQLWTDLRAL